MDALILMIEASSGSQQLLHLLDISILPYAPI